MRTREKLVATLIVSTGGLLVTGTMLFSLVNMPVLPDKPSYIPTKAFAQVSEDAYIPQPKTMTWEVEETILESEAKQEEIEETFVEPETEIFPAEEIEETFVEPEAYYEPQEPPVVQTETPVVQTYCESQETYSNGSDFQSDGVWYDDSYRYTWYSSQDLYHCQTQEWTLGDDGIYRDSDGYVVVASSDLDQGSVVEETPFGAAKVYDSGCASGTLDVYVGW